MVVVLGDNQAVDLGARARGEDGESLKEVVVPDDFDPAHHGLADKGELFARMDARAHAFASRAAGLES